MAASLQSVVGARAWIGRCAMRAHVGAHGRGAARRRARAEWTRRERAERSARTREPGRARGGRYARAWAVCGARAETPCTWIVCLVCEVLAKVRTRAPTL